MKKYLIFILFIFFGNCILGQFATEGTYSYTQEEDIYAYGEVIISSLTDSKFDFSIIIESEGLYEKVKGTAQIDFNKSTYSIGDCLITFVFTDNSVIIIENNNCDRKNYSINGIYYDQNALQVNKAVDEMFSELDEGMEDLVSESKESNYYSEDDHRSNIKIKHISKDKIEYTIHSLIEMPSFLNLKGYATIIDDVAISPDYKVMLIFSGSTLEFIYTDMSESNGIFIKE